MGSDTNEFENFINIMQDFLLQMEFLV